MDFNHKVRVERYCYKYVGEMVVYWANPKNGPRPRWDQVPKTLGDALHGYYWEGYFCNSMAKGNVSFDEVRKYAREIGEKYAQELVYVLLER